MADFLSVNTGIILLTVLVSYQAFKDSILFSKLMFNPYLIHHQKQVYRIVTHGFVHADTPHLLFNMFSCLYLPFSLFHNSSCVPFSTTSPSSSTII